MSTDYNSRDWMPPRAVEHFHVRADTSPASGASQRLLSVTTHPTAKE